MEQASAGVILSVVTPVYDDADCVEPFLARLVPVLEALTRPLLGTTFEILFVDDGSSPSNWRVLERAAKQDERIKALRLSRNFGKDTALTAGLQHAAGLAVIPMDVDLQDPPEIIPRMVEHWLGGADVVIGRRKARPGDRWLKRLSAHLFYRTFNRLADQPIAPDAGDFRLLGRRVVDALNQLPERSRFMKGVFDWVGFERAYVDYVREARESGYSKWRYWRLWNFALDGITGASTAPLRLWTYIGGATAFLAFLYAGLLMARTLVLGVDVPGYASLMVVVLLLGGLNLLSLGIIGEYLGRTYIEAKGRPLYLVRDSIGFGSEDPEALRTPSSRELSTPLAARAGRA